MNRPPGKRQQLRELLGVEVQWSYPHPAISCCWNGVIVRGEGKVVRIGRHLHMGECLVVSDGSSESYIRLSEVDRVKNAKTKRWRKACYVERT